MKNLIVKFARFQNPNPTAIVALEGNLNEMNAMQFKSDLLQFVKDGKKDCIVDLKDIQAMDLSGLNALAMAHKELLKRGKTLTIRTSSTGPLISLLHITKFNRILNVQLVA